MSDVHRSEARLDTEADSDAGREFHGATVEAALQAARDELELSEAEIEVQVIDSGREPSPGHEESVRAAAVRIWALDGRTARARSLLKGLLSVMGIEAAITVHRQTRDWYGHRPPAVLDVSGEDLGILIGWRGETLQALQTVLNLMLGDDDRLSRRVIVDVERYRARREAQVGELALRLAERVKQSGQRHMLDPMRGYERRSIHMALQDDPDLRTESVGAEPARRVVIHPAGGAAS